MTKEIVLTALTVIRGARSTEFVGPGQSAYPADYKDLNLIVIGTRHDTLAGGGWFNTRVDSLMLGWQ